MSELQSDEAEVSTNIYDDDPNPAAQEFDEPPPDEEEIGSEVEEDEESPSDLAPDSEGEHEENAQGLDDSAQEKVNKRIGKLTFEKKEAERQKAELEARLQQLEAQQLEQLQPTIPPVPDAFDDDYDAKMRQRDEALQQQALYQQQRQAYEAKQQQIEQAKLAQQQAEFSAKAASYTERANKLGISQDKLRQSADVLTKVQIQQDVVNYILDDEQGPLITAHLGSDVETALSIANMTPIQAVLYVEKNIKPRLSKAKQTKTPAPSKRVVSSRSEGKERYPHIKGAKFL